MPEPWDAEREVPGALARALIESQFPHLRPVELALLGVGWDNTAWLASGAWVFRFPRRQIAVELLRIEIAALPALVGRLPLPIPNPQLAGAPTAEYPWPFAGHRMLRGRLIHEARPADGERAGLAGPLGAFLRALHAIAPGSVPAAPPRDHLKPAERHRRAGILLRSLGRAGAIADRAALERILDEQPEYSSRTDTLVHGDCFFHNLLVDDAARLAAIIDWGDVHLGDPAIDLACAWGLLPAPARSDFLDAYGPVDAEMWQVARMRALHAGLTILDYARKTGDAARAAEAQVALRHVAND
ncbi:MAG: phosphotransferase [Phycisphaerales bacterium JB039]